MSRRWTVCLGVMLMLLVSRVARGEELVGRCELPNMQMPGLYRAAIQQLVAKSATLLRQCGRIAASPLVHLTIEPVRDLSGCRARSTVTRHASGVIEVRMELPLNRDLAELLAHELEHVLEQIEGLDLAQLARDGRKGVERVANGAFETVRAQRAGQMAALESIARPSIYVALVVPPAPRVMAD